MFLLALGRMFVSGEATDEGIYLQECFSARDSLCGKVTHVLSMLDPAMGVLGAFAIPNPNQVLCHH